MSRKDLPSPNTSNWPQRVTEELRVLMGKTGSASDRALTAGNLPGIGIQLPGGSGGGLISGGTYEPDLTPPPTPTGFTLSAAISHVFVEHAAPLYTQGHGHANTILMGAKVAPGGPLPTFSNAVELAHFQGVVYAYPSDPATTWRMWIFWETVDGVRSTIPAGGINGLAVTTGQDVSLLLDALTGKITESQLFGALGSRINLIDGSGTGSVNERIATVAAQSTGYNRANMISNGGFEYGLNQWVGNTSTFSAYDSFFGRIAVSVAHPASGGIYSPLAPAYPGFWYSVAADIQVYAASPAVASVGLRFYNDAGAVIGGSSGVNFQGPIEFSDDIAVRRAHSLENLSPAGTTGVRAVIFWQNAGGINLAFRAVKVERGRLPITSYITGAADVGTLAAIQTEAAARADADGAEALARTTLAAQVSSNLSAAVSTEATARAQVDGYLGAQQTVRVDIAGHVAGYGLSGSTPNGSGASATSSFGVRTNTFFVAPPALAQNTAPVAGYDGFVWLDTSVSPAVTRYWSGGGWTTASPALPFAIQTTPTTINGVYVPAGAYVKDAFIANGTIGNAKIGNLAVDDAKIANLSVSKILAGAMVIGQYINSANYVAGVQGWGINAAGNAEFNNVTMRGVVYAGAGAIGGINIAAGAVYSSNWAWDQSGFYLGADGNAYINNLRSRGSIMGGSYSGYAWPAAGLTGYYLGPEGLLVGNPNTGGRYFQLDSYGNVYTPQFSVINGSATFSGNLSAAGGTFSGNLSAAGGTFSGTLTAGAINAVNTINIAGNAVMVSASATFGAQTIPQGGLGNATWANLAALSLTFGSGGGFVVASFRLIGGTPGDRVVELQNTTTGVSVYLGTAPFVAGIHGETVVDFAPANGVNAYLLRAQYANNGNGGANFGPDAGGGLAIQYAKR